MRLTRWMVVVAVSIFTLAFALTARAQTRKPGLWKVTSTMTWQKSPFPSGASPMSTPHTNEICVTQQQIDKYGTVPPQVRGECQITNVLKSSNGMTADIECSGHMQGKGHVQASWTEENHSTSTVHFEGVMQMGPEPKPFEWTVQSTAIFESSDCGSVKPFDTK